MERLTIPDERIDEHTTRRKFIDMEAVREHAMEFYWRLKAYEDTGLMPEEITAMRHTLEEYHRTADPLLSAKAQGRVVVLPCKVGDKIYRIQKYFNDATLQSEIKVKACIVGSVSVDSMMTDDMVFLSFDRIGKTVFFTREDAEKALEGMRNG